MVHWLSFDKISFDYYVNGFTSIALIDCTIYSGMDSTTTNTVEWIFLIIPPKNKMNRPVALLTIDNDNIADNTTLLFY